MKFKKTGKVMPSAITMLLLAFAVFVLPFSALGAGTGTDSGNALGEKPMDPRKAFQFRWEQLENELILIWDIEPRYYLYKAKFKLKPGEGYAVESKRISRHSDTIDDPYFGLQEIHKKSAFIKAVLKKLPNANPTESKLTVVSQGCWEGGVCYPPQEHLVEFSDFAPAAAVPSGGVSPGSGAGAAKSAAVPSGGVSPGSGAGAAKSAAPPQTEERRLLEILLGGSPALIAFIFYFAGILLAFTPCVLPMVPILSGMITGGSANRSKIRAFKLSAAYVLSMSVAYTGAGLLAGLAGESLLPLLQNVWVIGGFSLLFLFFAFASFGWIKLEMPAAVQRFAGSAGSSASRDSVFGVGAMGFLSALIVGPCMAAPLAGVLLYVSQTGDALLGGYSLLMLSLGMGTPLILFAVSSDRFLPKKGAWMREINYLWGFAFVLLAVWMLERVVPKSAAFLMFAAALFGAAAFLIYRLRNKFYGGAFAGAAALAGAAFVAYGSALTAGAFTGGMSYLNPLERTPLFASSQPLEHLNFQTVSSPEELDRLLRLAKSSGKPAVLDYYADWCVACKEIEYFVFEDREVIENIRDSVLIRVDVTLSGEDSDSLLKRYGIFGPPAIIFYDDKGNTLEETRINSSIDAEKFLEFYRYSVSS